MLQKSALLPPRAVCDQLGGCTHLPKLGTDLVSTLSSLYVNDLSHLSQALLRFSAKVIRQAVNGGDSITRYKHGSLLKLERHRVARYTEQGLTARQRRLARKSSPHSFSNPQTFSRCCVCIFFPNNDAGIC